MKKHEEKINLLLVLDVNGNTVAIYHLSTNDPTKCDKFDKYLLSEGENNFDIHLVDEESID